MNTIKLTAMAFGLAAANAFAQSATEVQPTTEAPKAAEDKGVEFNISGRAEVDAYADAMTGDDQKLYHD
jgi:hypothetical protein